MKNKDKLLNCRLRCITADINNSNTNILTVNIWVNFITQLSLCINRLVGNNGTHPAKFSTSKLLFLIMWHKKMHLYHHHLTSQFNITDELLLSDNKISVKAQR